MANPVDVQAAKFGDLALLIGRILIGVLFLIAAYNKVKGYSGGIGYFGKLGVPAPQVMLPLTIVFEAAAGILLIIGYQTRLVALAIAAFCILTALVAHTNFGDGNQLNHFLKNLAVAGGALVLFAGGAGRQSVDARSG
jgi:putative oxidoreductase